MLKEIGHIYKRKFQNKELRSIQNLGYYENVQIVLYKKHFKNIWRRTSIYNKLISFFLKQATPKKPKNKKNQH